MRSTGSIQLIEIGKQLFARGGKINQDLYVWAREMKLYSRLIFWPLVFIIMRIAPTLNRVIPLFTNQSYFPLTYLHLISWYVHGVVNVLVFFINPIDHFIWFRRIICCECCCKKREIKVLDEIEQVVQVIDSEPPVTEESQLEKEEANEAEEQEVAASSTSNNAIVASSTEGDDGNNESSSKYYTMKLLEDEKQQ